MLIYDDQCDFCRRWSGRFARWTRRHSVRLVPLSDDRARALTGKTQVELERAMHLVTAEGAVFVGAAAVRELLALVPWGWVPRTAFRIPGAMRMADRVYVFVASRRQRSGCGGEHCGRLP